MRCVLCRTVERKHTALDAYLGRCELPPQPEQVAAIGKLHDQVGVDGRRHQLPADEVVAACGPMQTQQPSQPSARALRFHVLQLALARRLLHRQAVTL